MARLSHEYFWKYPFPGLIILGIDKTIVNRTRNAFEGIYAT